MSYEIIFLYSLFVTIAVEVFVVLFISQYFFKIQDKFKIIFAGIISSALTLPYFWFVLPAFIPDRVIYIIVGETAIVFIEAFIYFYLLKLKFKQAFILSLLANLSSILVGLLIM